MHRIVIFSEPVVDNGEVLYGKLYSGETEDKLIASAAADLKRLLIQEQFVGQQGEEWRKQEGWGLVHHDDGTESWNFDTDKYTNYMGYGIIVDQFVEHCWIPPTCLGLVSRWVPLRMSDCNDQDYLINRTIYDGINNANPNYIDWIVLDEPEDTTMEM